MTDRIEEDFIESLGLILQNDGLPRIAGRLLGVFVLYGGPLGFPELCDKLQVSRASVSTNSRLLVDLGAIERVAKPGERQDYFRLSEQPYAQLIERWIGRSRKAQATINKAADSLPSSKTEMRTRMAELSNFYSVMARASEAALDGLRHAPSADAQERAVLVPGE